MSYRVLIVDDDEDARALLRRALQHGGLDIEIDSASDGREALERIAAALPQMVITDVMMPRMNGFDLCLALRAGAQTADIPVLIVTALEDAAERARGFAVGATDYLTKPVHWSDLAPRLRALIGNGAGG